MSIKPLENQRSLFDSGLYLEEMLTRQECAEEFLFFRKNIWPKLLSLGPSLNEMYCADNGRPAINPVRLLGVTILQYMKKLPDQQAVERQRHGQADGVGRLQGADRRDGGRATA